MNENDDCAICLEEIKKYDYVILSCNHYFHYKCLQLWLNKKKDYIKLCPICDKVGEIVNVVDVPKIKKKKKIYIEEINDEFICCNIL